MTEHEELIAEARRWPRDGINEGRLINELADALEAEHNLARRLFAENLVLAEARNAAEARAATP